MGKKRRNQAPYTPASTVAPVARGERPWAEVDIYYLPGETKSRILAEFVQWYDGLTHGNSGGGRDYGGATAQDIRQTVEAVMVRLQNMNFGAGDDLLFVCGDQSDECRDCIGGRRENDELGKPVRMLCGSRK